MKTYKSLKTAMKSQKSKVPVTVDYEDFRETMTAAAAGIPHDTKNMGPKKKRKTNVLTRNYIEVMGKRKKLVK